MTALARAPERRPAETRAAQTRAAPPRAPEPRARRLVRAGGVVLAASWLLAPLVPLVLWAVAERWTFPAPLPTHWGLGGWSDARAAGADTALVRSLGLALLVAALATPAGAMAGRALARRTPDGRSRGGHGIGAALLLPVAVPPFAVVMGLATVALHLRVPAVAATVTVLAVAAVPYTTFVMWSAYAGYDEGYEQEARTLGASPRQVLLRVHLPLVAPALAAAAFLAFLVGWSDYVVTLLLGGGALVTLPLLVGSLTSASGNDAAVAAASLAAIAPPVLLLALTGLLARRGVAR